MSSSVSRLLRPFLLLCGVVGVFVIPWFVMPTRRVVSDSYVLGFNNTLAQLAAVLVAVALAFSAKKSNFSPFQRSPDAKSTPKYALWTGIALLFLNTLYFFVLPINYFGEIVDALPRLDFVLMGLRPYADFQFNYGPLLLFLPAFFVWASHFALSPTDGYGLALFCLSALGLALLWFVVHNLALNAKNRALLFILAALCNFNWNLGLSYTLPRFLWPYVFVLLLQRSQNHRPKSALWAFFGPCIGFLFSPETGVLSTAACVLFCLFALRQNRKTTFFALPATVLALVLAVWAQPDYFAAFRSFGGGGYNLPIYPTLYTLLFLIAFWLVLPQMGGAALAGRHPDAPLLAGYGGAALLALPAAFGRCDPQHTFFNGLGLFLAAIPFLQGVCATPQSFEKWLARASVAWSACLMVSFGVGSLQNAQLIAQQWKTGQKRLNRNFAGPNPDLETPQAQATLQRLTQGIPAGEKIGFPADCVEFHEILLKKHGLFQSEYHPGASPGVFTREQNARKMHDLAAMKYLLVPTEFLNAGALSPERKGAILSVWTLFPVVYTQRQKPYDPRLELVAFLKKNFQLRPRSDGYTLCVNGRFKPLPPSDKARRRPSFAARPRL